MHYDAAPWQLSIPLKRAAETECCRRALGTGTGLAHDRRYRQVRRVHVAREDAGDDQPRRHAAERVVRSPLALTLRIGAARLRHDVLDRDTDEHADGATDIDQRGAAATDVEVARHQHAAERPDAE